jgi:hypothetical protein
VSPYFVRIDKKFIDNNLIAFFLFSIEKFQSGPSSKFEEKEENMTNGPGESSGSRQISISS